MAVGTCWDGGGRGANYVWVSHLHFKWMKFCTLVYMCDFQYRPSYEFILALLLYTVVILKLYVLILAERAIAPHPLVPATMLYIHENTHNNDTIVYKISDRVS